MITEKLGDMQSQRQPPLHGETVASCRILLLVVLLPFLGCGRSQPSRPAYWWPEKILNAEERRQDIAEKTSRVVGLIKRERLAGLPFTAPEDIAWITAGDENHQPLFLREDGTTAPLDAPPSADPVHRGMVAELRVPLTASEIREYRWLGRKCAEAVESVCRQVSPGMNERAIEALLSDALMRHAIHPAAIRLASDERISQTGLSAPNDDLKADKALQVGVCGRRWGMHVSLTRMIHFGSVPGGLSQAAVAAAALNADFWARTLPGAMFQAGEPGGAIGYRMREWSSQGVTSHIAKSGQAFAWAPTVDGVRSEDTILIQGEDLEVLTRTRDWPVIESRARGRIYRLAAILIR